jgi:O-antigen ligase
MGIIIVQLMKIYLKNYTWGMPLDNLWKYKIVLGWGISNTIGEFIVVFMPAVFYLIHKEKRGYLYYILLAVAYIAVLLTLSRNALLFGTLTIGVGILANCFIGRHKKTHRYVVLSVMLIAVLMLCVLLFIGKFKGLFTFFIENGFSDRGRFKMWRDYVAYFKKSPIVGAGFAEFRDLYYNKWVDTAWQAHNTPIQVLGSTGLVGAIFYCIHRTQTAALLLRKPKSDRLFIGGCMAVLLLQSLLDPLFFRLYIAIFYSSLLWIIEQSYREDKLPLAK